MHSWEKVFTKKNIEILSLLRKGECHVRDIASQLRISPAKVHQSISVFTSIGLVSVTQRKNKKYIALTTNHPDWQHICGLLFDQKQHPSTTAPSVHPQSLTRFDMFSPLDFRYAHGVDSVSKALHPYLSETAFIHYLAKMEGAVALGLAEHGLCPAAAARTIAKAAILVTPQDVYAEEIRIKHNIRALTNCIRNIVPDDAKPYVHFTATSHDIICSADAARLKDCTQHALIPLLSRFLDVLITIACREKKTLQIGRTHGQHAEPITFGFALSLYVDRLGNRMLFLDQEARNLRGKFAGAVGAYNGQSLVVDDPLELERSVLKHMGILPSPASSQVVEPEYMTDFCHALISTFGVLANLADDMRHLQRSEINEIAESFGKDQVGSSTMPHKRNPINFENVKSLWKVAMPRMMTLYLDQICEHQRDLTNSASSRFVPELIALLYSAVHRLLRVFENIVVDKESMLKNFNQSREALLAEPAYLLLSLYKHPDAHEIVRKLSQKARDTNDSFSRLLFSDVSLTPYLSKLTVKQKELLEDPSRYIGIAAQRSEQLCAHWRSTIKKKSW